MSAYFSTYVNVSGTTEISVLMRSLSQRLSNFYCQIYNYGKESIAFGKTQIVHFVRLSGIVVWVLHY